MITVHNMMFNPKVLILLSCDSDESEVFVCLLPHPLILGMFSDGQYDLP